jgi:hypothetical protein
VSSWFAPANVVALALGVLVLEALIVASSGAQRRAARLAGVAAGAALLLAVRLALTGNDLGVVVLLAAGGLAHGAELAARRRDSR